MNNTGFANGMGQPLQPPSNFPQQQVPCSQYGVHPSQPAQGMMNGSPGGVPYGNAATAKKPSAKAMALIILGTGIVFLLVGLLMERGSDSVPARQTETSAVAKAMLSESLFSGKFVVEGHEYQMLKTTPSDLLSNGWTWADSDYLIKQDEIVPPGESELVALVKPEYEADLQIWITQSARESPRL